jgi:hypothetical protein
MAKHRRVKKDKKVDEDQRHLTKQKDSESSFDQSLARGTGPSSLTETPFYPRMEEHAAMLSSLPSAAQRNNFIMQLHQTYGNRYVQRLMESTDVQTKLTISEPGDIYEQEADRVADEVTGAVNSLVQSQEEEEELLQGKTLVQQQPEEEEELQMAPDLQRQEEEEEVQVAPVLQRQEEEEELQMQSAVGELETISREEDEIQADSHDSDGVKSATQQISSRESLGQKKPPEVKPDEKISLVAATAPVSRDLTAKDMVNASGLTRIRLSDVTIKGTVNEDNGEYKISVTKASMKIHWGIESPPSYQVPDARDKGNITQANYQTVIDTLKNYETRQYAGGWHHPDATEVHEKNHVDWYKAQIIATWPPIETVIEDHVLGDVPAKKSKWEGFKSIFGASKVQKDMKEYLEQKKSDWFNAFGVAPEPPAYAAGQAVLDGIITNIETYATQKGWMA